MNDSLLLAVERTENLVRRGSHPRLSVILIVEGSPSYAMRALESIQNQDLYDLQIVVVCRGVVAGVRHSLEVAADRDIHIDLIDVEDPAPGACLRAGFAASRGSQIIAMNANEWFGAGSPFRRWSKAPATLLLTSCFPLFRSIATMFTANVIPEFWTRHPFLKMRTGGLPDPIGFLWFNPTDLWRAV